MERAQILEEIGKMTVLELSQLIKDMEEKFGVSAAAAVAVAVVVHGLAGKAVAVDENTALVLPHSDPGEQRGIGAGNCWLIRGPGPKAAVSILGSVVTHG